MLSIHQQLEDRIQKYLSPTFLDIKNQSEKHKSHQEGPKEADAETHFHLKIISSTFTGLTRIERHRLVYGLLDDLLKKHIHALSLTLLDNEQT